MNEQQLTKKQRRELRKQEFQKQRAKEQNQKKNNKIIIGIVIIVLVVVFGIFLRSKIQNPSDLVDQERHSVPFKGLESSTVVVREYSDFQCPACRAATPFIKDLMSRYGDKIRFEYINFPLVSIHRNAFKAAEAALCAHDQGKFWEYHDTLFKEQDTWSQKVLPSSKFKEYAEQLALNSEEFDHCLDSDSKKSIVQADRDAANALGINSTPTFFINDKRLVGVPNRDTWDKELEAVLNQ